MKVLAWNLNHRAARRRIPSWIAAAIDEQAPDVLVLTEYVEGPDHDFFLATLNANGLSTFSCSTQPGRENQVLIASRDTQRRYELVAPDIHPSVPSNSLKVWLGIPGLTVFGFRMPAFEAKERAALKRLTWNWLLGTRRHIAQRTPGRTPSGSSTIRHGAWRELAGYAALARLLIAYIDDARAVDDKEALKILKLHAN